jgi:hypothetical protein
MEGGVQPTNFVAGLAPQLPLNASLLTGPVGPGEHAPPEALLRRAIQRQASLSQPVEFESDALGRRFGEVQPLLSNTRRHRSSAGRIRSRANNRLRCQVRRTAWQPSFLCTVPTLAGGAGDG